MHFENFQSSHGEMSLSLTTCFDVVVYLCENLKIHQQVHDFKLRISQHDSDSRYYRYGRYFGIRNGRNTNVLHDVIFIFVVIHSVAFKNRNSNNNDDNMFIFYLVNKRRQTNACTRLSLKPVSVLKLDAILHIVSPLLLSMQKYIQ